MIHPNHLTLFSNISFLLFALKLNHSINDARLLNFCVMVTRQWFIEACEDAESFCIYNTIMMT